MPAIDFSDPQIRNLGAVLREYARKTPGSICLMLEDSNFTFAEVNDSANRVANTLHAMGVRKGDRVVIFMRSRVEYVELVFGINKLGAIWVPINAEYKGEWLLEAINDCLPTVLISESAMSERLAPVIDRMNCQSLIMADGAGALSKRAGITDYEVIRRASSAEPALVEIAPGDTAAILWTSGTTGKSKGVMQSHNAWMHAGEEGNKNYDTRDDDISYNCMPLYNSGSWNASIFRAIIAGIPVALDGPFSATHFWDRIRKFGATQAQTLGAMHMFLWNKPETPQDADNPLRVAAMVPMPEDIINPFMRRFGMERIIQGYGQSEVMILLTRVCLPGEKRNPNSLGRVSPDIELRLVDDNDVEVGPGVAGEFALRPKKQNIIFSGYFNQTEVTSEAFRNGYYHTGDIGMRDADGDYYFVDRKKDYIRYKGRSISSFQVERVAGAHPAIEACAAYGVPSAELESESEIKLDIVLKPGKAVDPADVARFINDNGPYFLVPRYIEIVEALPYTPTNKVEKYRLREKGVGAKAWDRLANNFELVR
jgi:crotonobetaine/carnitine-CoA ligase